MVDFDNIVTIKEYCDRTANMYSDRSGYIIRKLNKGELLPGMKRARKSGSTWLIELEAEKK